MNYEKEIGKIAKINKDSLLLLTLSEDFKKEVIFWRKKIGIPINGFRKDQAEDISKLYKKEEKAVEVTTATKDILKKFKLTDNFTKSVMLYLLYNKISLVSTNHAIEMSDEYIKVRIYSKPTKLEWGLIKKEVDSAVRAIESKKYKFLEKLNYPNGSKSLRPKRNINRDLKILEKLKDIGKDLTEEVSRETIKYATADVEADSFPEGTVQQSKRNETNIRVIKHRKKPYIKRSE